MNFPLKLSGGPSLSLDNALGADNYLISITDFDNVIRDFFLGFVKLHILHHAARAPVFGLDVIRELASHGYQLSPGTLYPVLHQLERQGYLKSEKQVVSGKARKYYSATRAGKKALGAAYTKARELLDEIAEDKDQ